MLGLLTTLIITLSSLNIFLATESTPSGFKLSIKEEFIENIKSTFLPQILIKLSNYTLQDQEFEINVKISKIIIDLKNILINLDNNITDTDLQVKFHDSNKISVDIQNVKGRINSDNTFSLLFVKGYSHLNANIKSLSVHLDFLIGEVESYEIKGKMLPMLTLQNININLDFDYDITGDWLSKIANSKLIKEFIIISVKNQINNLLSSSLMTTVNTSIRTIISNLSTKILLNKNGLTLDYEINSSPKIEEEKFLSLFSKGLIFNTNIPQTNNPPFSMTENIPDFNESDKLAELIITDYTVNSALYSLFLSGMLKVNIDNSVLPNNFPLKVNTTVLDILFNGVSKKYGYDFPVEMNCEATENPIIKFSEENFNIALNFKCKINVLVSENVKEQAYYFSSSLIANVKFALLENGNIQVNINSAKVENTQMIETKVEETNIQNVENILNFVSNAGLTYVNKNYLNDIKIKLPKIKGIDINNSTAVIKNDYVDIHVTPNIQNLKFLN